jgi:Skp family chaperone for outer membrane proteins
LRDRGNVGYLEEGERTVKRMVVITAGVATLAGGIYLGSRLWAQTGADAPVPKHPDTHIAVLNLSYVIKEYKKAGQYDQEFKGVLQKYDTELQGLDGKLQVDKKRFTDPATPAPEKEKIQAEAKQLERAIADRKEEVQKELTKKRQEQIVILYRDVEQYVSILAKSKGIDLVVHYNDLPPGSPDIYSAPNIARKMTSEACMPIYVAQGMNISDEVVTGLNWNYNRASQANAAPAANAAPPGR